MKKAVQQYVGLDVHKESIQVAVRDKDGKVLSNTRISNKDSEVREIFAKILENAKCVRVFGLVRAGLSPNSPEFLKTTENSSGSGVQKGGNSEKHTD